jgi:Leucine-rich repeat (LRR) protein
LLVLLIFHYPAIAAAQNCISSIINLNNQPAVNAFQATYGPCTRVSQDLNIEDFSTPGNEIVDLTPLAGLTEVGRSLTISHTSVTSLTGLESLTTVGSLGLTDNPNLLDLAALQNLTTAGGLGFGQNTSLASLAGMSSLTHVGSLSISGNGLTDLSGLPDNSVVALDSLFLGETNLSGLPESLTEVGELTITDSSLISNITDLSGLPGPLQVRELLIFNTWELTSLNGLPALNGLERIRLEGNEMLVDLSALAAGTMSSVDPAETDIIVVWNFGLTSLAGLPAVSKLGRLEVTNNAQLETLAGLENLQELWGNLWLVENPSLADCSVLRTVLDAVDDGDPGPGTSLNPADPPDTLGLDWLTIADNRPVYPGEPSPATSCNSITEILASPADLIYANSFEGG